MEKLINGNLVRKIVAYRTKENKEWIHVTEERFLWIFKWKCDYWCWRDPCFGSYSSEEIGRHLEEFVESFYKDGKIYDYPCINFIFDSKHSQTKFFNSDEEMFKYLEEFKQQFGKSFILV